MDNIPTSPNPRDSTHIPGQHTYLNAPPWAGHPLGRTAPWAGHPWTAHPCWTAHIPGQHTHTPGQHTHTSWPPRSTSQQVGDTSSGSSGRVRGGAKKHEIYAAAFGGHLFNDLFSRGQGGSWPPRPPLDLLLDTHPTGMLSCSNCYHYFSFANFHFFEDILCDNPRKWRINILVMLWRENILVMLWRGNILVMFPCVYFKSENRCRHCSLFRVSFTVSSLFSSATHERNNCNMLCSCSIMVQVAIFSK